MARVEDYHKTLCDIWAKAATGCVVPDMKQFSDNLSADTAISIDDVFNASAVSPSKADSILSQIIILGHLRQAWEYNTDRKTYPDIIKAYEKADDHIVKAFNLARSIGMQHHELTSHIKLEETVRRNVGPFIASITPQQKP